MAMHNFGTNSLQHEQQLKLQQQTSSGTDSSTWHNNNNNNSNLSNNDHMDDSQQSSVANSLNDHKTENSTTQPNNRANLNRHQQQHQPQLQSQSQQYHGIFSPQIPPSLQSSLASRVDQIIRTTLNDSPAYTPHTSKNSATGNIINNNNNITANTTSMPLPASSSSLIFNTSTSSTSTTSATQNILSHPPNSGIGLMSNATNSPITSIYRSNLPDMGDSSNNPSNNNLAKTSPSHSALAAAAALQSLNQSHIKRSQQLAHSQPSPYSSIPGSGLAIKPPSSGSGTPVPQAAHGANQHTPRINASSEPNHLSFASEQSEIGSINFSSRPQQSNANSLNNLSSKLPPSSFGLSSSNWQDQAMHTNNMIPRLPPLHGLSSSMPPYSMVSAHTSSFGIVNSQPHSGVPINNGNSMIGSDSDSLSKLNAIKNSPGQSNPMQFRDEKSLPLSFPTLLSNKQNQPNIENLRSLPPSNASETPPLERITEEKLAVFAYNLLSIAVPGKQHCKQIVQLDEDMKNSIQNGEFYTKFSHVANGILTNQMIVPNFSIIDYLRRDRFPPQEVEHIERVNRSLSMSNLLCLMELVRQRPWLPPGKSGPELAKFNQLPDFSLINTSGVPNQNCQTDHLSIVNHQHSSPQKVQSFLSSSPNRSEMLGPQGVDKSRRSSQSPSDTSRSQLVSNSKFLNATNPNHQHVPSIIGNSQFAPPLYPSNHQQHTSPQANRSSPFQPPMSIASHPQARPPRSHSTIGGLGVGTFNASYGLTSPQIRQPPAAHQSSLKPNLAGLAADMSTVTPQAHSSGVPVTAHMSSKKPQTIKLQDSLPSISKPNVKSSQQPTGPLIFATNRSGFKDPTSTLDFQHQLARSDFDSSQTLPIQSMMGFRQQEMSNRELSMRRSTTPQLLQSNLTASNSNQIDLSRHPNILDGTMNSHMQINAVNHQINNLPSPNMGVPMNKNIGQNIQLTSTMPPPSMDHRQFNNDMSNRHLNMTTGLGVPTSAASESQLKQYNALMAAYQQQQLIMPGRGSDSSMGSVTAINHQVPTSMIMNQSQRLCEPMHVEIQQAKQSQSQSSSPKSVNQRSIITGSGSASARRSKKAKPSPTSTGQSMDIKSNVCDITNQAGSKLMSADNSGPTSIEMTNSVKESSQTFQDQSATKQDMYFDVRKPHEVSVGTSNDSTNFVGGDRQSSVCNVSSNVSPRASVVINVSNQKNADNHSSLQQCTETIPNDSNTIPVTTPKIVGGSENVSTISVPLETKKSPDTNLPNIAVDQTSKYQKLFTKKAWLKNYDQEDQARTNEETISLEEKMVIANNTTTKIDDNSIPSTADLEVNDKPASPPVKTNGGNKNGRSTKIDKKRVKDGKSKKTNLLNAAKATKVITKSADNDSEETNASTSELDDTDETDSVKSTSDKKLRRMPRRKVKVNSDRELSDQANTNTKSRSLRETLDKDMSARKRGKKDKMASVDIMTGPSKRKHNSDDESVRQKTKKIKENSVKHPGKSSSPAPKTKRRAGEKFLQTQPCYEIVPKSIRCLECRRVRQPSYKGDKIIQSKQASKANWDDFCRFFEFRKLRFNKSEQIVVAGFSEASDAKQSDLRLWLPSEVGEVPQNITYRVAKFILSNIGDEFCKLVLQERAVSKIYESRSGDKRATWKRAVNGLRELCDVCSTTLFNCHYVCDRCGFVVCIDCHESRINSHEDAIVDIVTKKEAGELKSNIDSNQNDLAEQVVAINKKSKKDSYGWIFCAKHEEHSHEKLTLAKIIAGDCLEEVWELLHEMREKLNLGKCYSCLKSNLQSDKDGEKISIKHEIGEEHEGSHSTLKGLLLASNNSPVNPSLDNKHDTISSDNDFEKQEKQTSVSKDDQLSKIFDFVSEEDSQDDSKQVSAAIEGCIASLAVEGGENSVLNNNDHMISDTNNKTSLKLCDGDLLILTHTRHKENIRLFRDHWRHGKPVLVRGVHNRMNIDMWLPQFFLGKFGDYRSDLVDCRNGDIHRQSMRKYWDGFEPSSSKKKSKDDILPGHIPVANNEEPSAVSTSYYSGSALWRLKDWPPGQDFNEILPEHYDDFMNNLPLKSYTTRTGRLNLACRLPKEMLKPDLGPKMYSAYGTTKFPERGTTNLHLDISDAVNVMVYVGGAMPFSQGSSEYSEIYDSTINDCYVDLAMKEQIRQNKLIPGALWHIFRPSDAPKIRKFLDKVSEECKISPEKRIDPIHDQIWYLDQNLLNRLLSEYGVKSYPILQCMGDAILIPAGAPHQVKNLQNCIKVANDFVSPENIKYCLQLTDEFRKLPETHINQEDKLQIKNIMYHSVKESIQYIKMFDSGKVSLSDESSDEDDFNDASDQKSN